MVRTVPTVWAAMLLGAAVLPGCHPHALRSAGSSSPSGPLLALTPRFNIEPDLTGLPTTNPLPVRPAKYRNLTAADCRKFAIQNAPFADELDNHAQNQPPKHAHWHPRQDRAAQFASQIRGHAADEIRNRAAADALEQFFQLARAEGQFDLLAEAAGLLRDQIESANKLVQSGLKDRAAVDAIRSQLTDLEAQMARLNAVIGQLNASLQARLGLDRSNPMPLWPDDPVLVRPDDVDVEQAVATGLHYRPELNLLRILASDDSPERASLRNQVLSGLNPLLAATPPASGFGTSTLLPALTKHASHPDSSVRHLNRLVGEREQQAEAEIIAAIHELQGQRAIVIAKAAETQRLAREVKELQKRQHAGQQVAADLAQAQLDWIRARGDLLKAAVDWNIAEVKLRQAMGILIREC